LGCLPRCAAPRRVSALSRGLGLSAPANLLRLQELGN
jgi:hypothetical protein